MTGDPDRGSDRSPDRSAGHHPGVPPTRISRRTAIGLGAAVLAGAALGPDPAAAQPEPSAGRDLLDRLRPEIAPREAWGADLAVTGPIVPEDDVRFLLVHHTASPNDYGPDDVVDLIRGFHRFHTSAEKGWPDVAYNFLIDRYGGIWEARAGSIAGPVRGDATGGSQGFALLCSLIGNHGGAPVTDEARASLVGLLAWLAERHTIDTEPGATVDFVSRGSNRWAEGTPVVASTISGHRDMSQTTCPGDFAYDLLAEDLPRAVTDVRLAAAADLAATASTAPAATLVTPTTAPPTTAPTTTPPTSAPAGDGDAEEAGADPSPGADDDGPLAGVDLPIVAAGGAAVIGAAALLARGRGGRAAEGEPD